MPGDVDTLLRRPATGTPAAPLVRIVGTRPALSVAAERGYIDDVIVPHETRPKIVTALETLQNKRAAWPPPQARQHSGRPRSAV